MFNYVLVISNAKGEVVTKYNLEAGESRKGTFTTVFASQGNKAVPFGKLYVDESKLTNGEGKKTKKG